MEPEANTQNIRFLYQRVENKCEILEAIMTLEFHDMTLLSGDPAKRNEIQRQLVYDIKQTVESIRLQTLYKE